MVERARQGGARRPTVVEPIIDLRWRGCHPASLVSIRPHGV